MTRRFAAEMAAVADPASSCREAELVGHARLCRVGETAAARAADGVAVVREEGEAVRSPLREAKEAWT